MSEVTTTDAPGVEARAAEAARPESGRQEPTRAETARPVATRPQQPRQILLASIFAAVATALGAAFWWPIYEHPRFILMVGAGTLLAVELGATFALRRWPTWALMLATAGLFLIVGVPLAVPSRAINGVLPSADGLLDLVAGVALGWKQLLTITIPVGEYQALLVPPFVLVLVSAVFAVRVGALERGASNAVIGPVVLGIMGILFGGPLTPEAVPLALGLLAVCLAWLVGRRLVRRRAALTAQGAGGRGSGTVRSVASGAGILVIAALVSIAATAAFPPMSDRQLLREQVDQPFDPRDEPSPLAGFRSYLREGTVDSVLFHVTGLEEGDRVRLAALDRYDGVVYGVGGPTDEGSGTFIRVPTSVPPSDVEGTERRIEIEPAAYSDVWLPTVGHVEQLGFWGGTRDDDFVLNVATRTAVLLGGVRGGESYAMRTTISPLVEISALRNMTPGDAVVPRLEVLPEGVAPLLDTWVAGMSEPGRRLATVLTRLQDSGYISHGLSPDEPPSRSGHGADRITELVTSPRMIGDAEQYAVVAAIMARQLGFPARVVMGFAPEAAGSAEVVDVVGGDITAWIEVHTAERGWLAIDPVPPVRPIPEEEPEEVNHVSHPQSVVPPPAESTGDSDEQSPPESNREDPDEGDPVLAAFLAVARVVGIVLLVLAIIAAPFLLIIAAKHQRRRRRRKAGDAVTRVRGAWDEFADTAVDHGVEPPGAATRLEFAARVGTVPAQVVAAAVDRATFAPEQVSETEVSRVWNAVDELRAAFTATANARERAKALVSLRSFRTGYRGKRAYGGRQESR